MADQKTGKQQIAEWLDRKRQSLGLSTRELAKAVGVSNSTMQIYLDPSQPHDPQPDVLRRLAEFFEIDYMTMFVIAYNMVDTRAETELSEYYLLNLYRKLSSDNKEAVIGLCQNLAGENRQAGELIREAIAKGIELRQRQLGRVEDIMRAIVAKTPIQSERNIMSTSIHLLERAYCKHVSEENIQKVTQHPLAIAIMDVLLPHKHMSPLEKLMYLAYPDPAKESYPDRVSEQTRKEIRDTWDVLLRTAKKEV